MKARRDQRLWIPAFAGMTKPRSLALPPSSREKGPASLDRLSSAPKLARTAAPPHHPRMTSTALFPALLGDDAWHSLPPAVQAMHGSSSTVHAHGVADIAGDQRPPARWLRRLLGLPAPGPAQALALTIARHDGREVWTRRFASRQMRSTLGRRSGSPLLYESLGPARLGFALRQDDDAIDWQLRSVHFLGLPCPRALRGEVLSRSGIRDGRYYFSVDVRLPWLGQLVAYQGWLEAQSGEPMPDEH